MTKAPDAFRSIGEVSRLIGVAPHVLRYWEGQFPQLSPVKRADGRRYYRPDDVRLAAGLCQVLREDGLSIRGAKRLLTEDRGAGLRQIGAARLGILLDPEAGQPALSSGPVVRLAVPKPAAADWPQQALTAEGTVNPAAQPALIEPIRPIPAQPAPPVAEPAASAAHPREAAAAVLAPPPAASAKPATAPMPSQQIQLDLSSDSVALPEDRNTALDSPNADPEPQLAPSDSAISDDSSAESAQSGAIPAAEWLGLLDRVLGKLHHRRAALPQAAAALRDALKSAL